MSMQDEDNRSSQVFTSIATALEARRELALDSVEILMEGLRVGDPVAVHLGLRGLGVNESTEIYQKIGMMSHSLHSLLSDFRHDLAQAADPASGATITNAAEKLEEVLQLGSNAADRTAVLVRQVAELLHQQEYAMQIAREVLNDDSITEIERRKRLNAFLTKQESCVTGIRVVNHDVLMTQSFQDLTSKVLKKVIGAIKHIEERLVELDSTYSELDAE